jgi:hypothetical protein
MYKLFDENIWGNITKSYNKSIARQEASSNEVTSEFKEKISKLKNVNIVKLDGESHHKNFKSR